MTIPTFGYEGQRVIVTGGGGSGMGAAAVRQLNDLGAEVHVLDLREPSVEVASYQNVDLKNPDAITAAIQQIGGPVKALFNCVGVPGNHTSPVDTLLINFAGVKHLTEQVIPLMGEGSAITSITSQGGAGWPAHLAMWLERASTTSFGEAESWLNAHPDDISMAYPASKEALNVWTMYSATNLGEKGIRQNAILPGPTATPMSADFVASTSKHFMDNYPIPLGRPQTPDEQAAAMVFLNSDLAGAITGVLLLTDGGGMASLTTGQRQLPELQIAGDER